MAGGRDARPTIRRARPRPDAGPAAQRVPDAADRDVVRIETGYPVTGDPQLAAERPVTSSVQLSADGTRVALSELVFFDPEAEPVPAP